LLAGAKENTMNPMFEVESLAAETLALQAIVIGVFGRLAQANPDFYHAIGLGFDDASNYVEQITIKLGKQASPAHTSKSLQIVEGLRSTTLGKPRDPKHRV
jgi:hypothetical protein